MKNVNITDCVKYIPDCYYQRIQTCDYNINVSFQIIFDIFPTFNQRKLYMAAYPMLHVVSDVLINRAIIVLNTIFTTGQAFTTFATQVRTYNKRPSPRLWILISKVWYRI